jgi:hypothetical protein
MYSWKKSRFVLHLTQDPTPTSEVGAKTLTMFNCFVDEDSDKLNVVEFMQVRFGSKSCFLYLGLLTTSSIDDEQY